VNAVPALPAALSGLVLFLVPGLLFLAWLSREERAALPFDEALFLLVAVSVLPTAWLGLALAEAGRFSLTLAAGLVAALAALLALLFRCRLGPPLPRPQGAAEVVPALVVLAVSFALHARPSEYLLGGRDPGVYVAAMAHIGRTGGIAYVDPVVLSVPAQDVRLFYRNPDDSDYTWGRFSGFRLERPQTGRVVPEFFHVFPAFGAFLFQAMGVKGALATPPIFGVLGTLGAFFVFRRLFGPAAALLGALLLGVNVVQVWFARYPVSEGFSQFLLFLGTLALLHWEERGGAAFGALAGAAMGLSLLVRIDSVLVLLPLGLYLMIRRAHGDLPWRRLAPLLLPLAVLSLHTVAHALLFSRKYALNIVRRPYWDRPLWFWVLLATGGALLVLLAHRHGPPLVRKLEAHHEALRAAVIAGLAVLALYACFLRPQLSAWAGADGNKPSQMWSPQAGVDRDGDGRLSPDERRPDPPPLLGALGFRRLAAHDAQSLVRLGWFVTPLGLGLGLLGLMLAVRDWRSPYLFPVLLALTFGGFYFYKIRVWNDYFFALRRFVPVVLPFLLGFAAFFLARLAARGKVLRGLAAALALVLFALFARDTARIARHVDWRHAVRFVADVARRFGPEDVVVFEHAESIHLLSLPLWAVHGVNVLELSRFDPERECPGCLDHLIRSWRGRYRNIYFVYTYRSKLCSLFLERVPSPDYRFGTTEWDRTYEVPPTRAVGQGLSFTIARVVLPEELQVPPLPEVDVGRTDDVLVSGFYDKEGGGDLTYRWTGACASIYLPGARPGAEVVIAAGAGRRPPTKPAVVQVSLSGRPLGTFTAGAAWSEHAFVLPDPLPPGPAVLRLDVPAWRPVNTDPASRDTRDLGVMVDRVRIRDLAEPGRDLRGR
jgi:hypothetical protein